MIIQICIGSACHLKGSYSVIESLQQLIKQDRLENEITIKAAFCLGHCTEAVSIRVDDEPVIGVDPLEVKAFYEQLKYRL